MTAEELAKVLESVASAQLLKDISDLQFNPDNPDEEEFNKLLKKAGAVCEQKFFSQIKKGVNR